MGILLKRWAVRTSRLLMVCIIGFAIPHDSLMSSVASDTHFQTLMRQQLSSKETKTENPLDAHSNFVTLQMLNEDLSLPMVIESQYGQFRQNKQDVLLPQRTTMWQGRGQLAASQCWYDLKNRRLNARGNVRLCHEDGTVALCETLKLGLQKKTGQAKNIQVVSPQRWRLSAKKMIQTPDKTKWSWGSFTPCSVCKITDFPLWSLHAKDMTWSRRTKRLSCRKAMLNVWGRPVLKCPRISFATSRSSGWLIPRLGQTQPLGWFAGMPYFVALSPQHDVTITPFATTRAGGILSADYRSHTWFHRTRVQGAYNYYPSYDIGQGSYPEFSALNNLSSQHPGSALMPRRWNEGKEQHDASRGFLHGESMCRLNDTTRLLVNQWWVSDDAFLASRPLFGFTQAPYLPSVLQLEHLTPHSHGFVRDLRYRSLQPAWQTRSPTSSVSPELSYAWFTPMDWPTPDRLMARVHAIGEAQWNTSSMKRLVGDLQWNRVHHTSCGLTHDIQMRLIGVSYDLAQQPFGLNPTPLASPNALFSSASWTSRWSLFSPIGGVVTPIVQVVGSPSVLGAKETPVNHDSQCLWFDETNVFQMQRFGGYDRLDDHSRINGGVEWGFSPTTNMDIHAVIAQSYAWQQPNPALLPVGVRLGASDLITAVSVQHRGLNLIYRSRLHPVIQRVAMQEMAWGVGPDKVRLSGSYIYTSEQAIRDIEITPYDLHQYTSQCTIQWTERWKTSLFGTYNLNPCHITSETAWRDIGGEVVFGNECLFAQITIQKSFYTFQGMKPGWSISLAIHLKTLSSPSSAQRRFEHDIFSSQYQESWVTSRPSF